MPTHRLPPPTLANRKPAMVGLVASMVLLALLFAGSSGRAQSSAGTTAPVAGTPPAGAAGAAGAARDSAAGSELGRLVSLLAREERRCTERCYTLSRLRISGSLDRQPLEFELEGSVNAREAVDVPLFGPPDRVRVDAVTENGKPAAIGFEKDHYYLHTDRTRFVVSGKLTLAGELTLTIPGPLNTFEAVLGGGRVAEGTLLSGLSGTSLHFELGAADIPKLEPTLFQVARAVRVTKNIEFEYRLTMQSGAELGLVRLGLPHGEKVLDVSGSTGWRTEEKALVLPTTGRRAEVVVTGTLSALHEFAPDPRSTFEWWLFESDPEHRVRVEGPAQQVDSAKSPIQKTQPTSRLFLVKKGQRLKASVEALVGSEVLAAVVGRQQRTAVITRTGDAVFDDRLAYENNGIDYLIYSPQGRPIFLATDEESERLMHREGTDTELMIPLRTGRHTARIQSLASASLGLLGGRVDVPMPTHPLTASRAELTLGLPAGVYPLMTLGGDEPELLVGYGGVVATLIAVVMAWRALRGWRRRLLGAIGLAGLWFVAPALYVVLVVALMAAGSAWLLSRLAGVRPWLAVVIVAVPLGFLGLIAAAAMVTQGSRGHLAREPSWESAPVTAGGADRAKSVADTGNFMAQKADGGVLHGVTPVALPLPDYEVAVTIRREFVTRDRPFAPAVYYATAWLAWPAFAAWALAVLGLALAHRRELAAGWVSLRTRLAAPPPRKGPPPVPEVPAARPRTPEDEAPSEH